ncbi:MAG: response regulator, partial [Bacteroidetes bacterium]|nr:response regulator [Bacteroidota bacterium]
MSKGKILITEDNSGVAELIKRMVISLGYEIVAIAVSGLEAIEFAKKHKPDLILMDINLKGEMDGIKAAQIINKEFDKPIIFITMFSDEKTTKREIDAGPYGYILKPFELNTLKTTLEIALYKNKTELKIKESELWCKLAFDSIEECIIMTTKEGYINYINYAAENTLGYTLNECIGLNYEDLLNIYKSVPDEYFICAIQDHENNPQDLLNSKWLIDRNNKHIPIEETVSDIKDSNNNFLGKVIILKDMTQKRESQLAIVSARNFYISLLEDFPVPIWRANTEGNFNYFNNTWLEITGKNLSQEIHFGLVERIHEEDRDDFIALFHSAFQKRERFDSEFRILNKENNYSWIYAVGTPFNDLHKKFGGFLFAGIDMTKRKVLEKELRTAITKVEIASKAKSDFIANMSHEIRTPLNGIIGLTELLFETKLSMVQKEYLEMVKHSSDVLLNLLNNLLNQSKLEAGKEIIKETEFILSEIVDDIWNPIAAQASTKKLTTNKKYNFNIDRIILADKIKIQQIISNLLSNAVKFTEKGSIELSITSESEVEYSDKDSRLFNLHIVVKDTGIGIPKDQHERIFDTFTQVDSSYTKKYAGVGLGLCIVKTLVQLFNGKIWIESEPGVGSEFHVILVLKYAEEEIYNNK